MSRYWIMAGFIGIFIIISAFLPAQGKNSGSESSQSGVARREILPPPPPVEDRFAQGLERAVFAGGCFWGVEAVFESLEGVALAESGYTGGREQSANYRAVSSGKTNHAEAVQVLFDPEVISYATLLDVFFTVAHDPTQLNYQGPDHGRQYRSALFVTGDSQRAAALDRIQILEENQQFDEPIVTEIAVLDQFFQAEEYHQDFMRNNPTQPYIVYWDIPKIDHLIETYPELIRQ